MNTTHWYKSFTRAAASAALTLGIVFGGSAVAQTGKANPYNLIDPTRISVGTMGDARPYVFVDRTASSRASTSNYSSTWRAGSDLTRIRSSSPDRTSRP